ncbi:MAG: glutamate--cysteine ligase [Candidatus Nanopelagicales bacterium]
MEFNSSARSTIGIEVEFGIVDRETGELVACAIELLNEAGQPWPGGEHPKAKNELFQPSLEVITGVCENPAEAIADLATTLRELKPLLDARGLGLESTGTHPFATWNGLPVTPDPRYLEMIDRLQWPAFRLLIHGVHVHVGVRSAEKAIVTTNVLGMYLPLFMALSASSPYWMGSDTGLASARTKIFEGLPTTGIPPQLADWAAYDQLVNALLSSGAIESIRSIWWDVRPHPDFGTVELRMCDGIPTLRETATVAALAQSLVTYVDEVLDAGKGFELLPDWVLKENKWRACRFGPDADLIIDRSGHTQPLTEQLSELLEVLSPVAQRLGCLDELLGANDIIETGPSFVRQRRVLDQGGTLVDVVKSVVAEFDASLAEAP